jgi:hypothetical protein
MSAVAGCALLVVASLLGGSLVDAKAEQGPVIARITQALAASGITCEDGQFWSIPPKGQSTLDCANFQVDVFNNNAEVERFLRWKVKPQDAQILRHFGRPSFIVRTRTWVVLTAKKHLARALLARTSGRMTTISP